AGAVTGGFQEVALACDQTALLETAPGHATRCASTTYVEAFAAERHRLEDQGATAQELWAGLEAFNLGRLRLASKGLERQGTELVEVDPETQRRQGLYMIGQVAALRSEPTTLAALHEDVSAGSSRTLAAAADVVREQQAALAPPGPEPAQVAI